MANNNQIYKMSNAGGFKSLNRYYDMLAGNTTWNPWSPDGAFDALATTTLSATTSTITFAGIPNTYKHLQIRFAALPATGGGSQRIRCQFNSDTGNNYATHLLFGSGTAVASAAGSSINQISVSSILGNSNTPNVGVLDILDYSSTSKYKTTRCLSGVDTNGGGEVAFTSGLWMNTAATTAISLYYDGVNLAQYSQFTLYGVR